MKQLLFCSFVILILSCNSKGTNDENIELLPGQIYLKTQPVEKSKQDILNHIGVRVYGEYEVKMKTANTNYFKFIAVVKIPYGGGDIEPELLSLQTFDHCFFYEDAEVINNDTFYTKSLSFNFTVDNRLNDILRNDSLYFTTYGSRYMPVKTPLQIGVYRSIRNASMIYSDNNLVPLFQASVNIPGLDQEKVNTSMLFGFVSYDCKKNIDWNGFFNSRSFIFNVWSQGTFEDTRIDDYSVNGFSMNLEGE